MDCVKRFADFVRLKMAGKSYSQLAREIGDISPTTISNIFAISRIPEPDSLRKMAPVLGVPESVLLALAGHIPADCEIVSIEPLVVIELRTNEPLSEEAKRQVIDFVTAWKAQHFPSQ